VLVAYDLAVVPKCKLEDNDIPLPTQHLNYEH